MRGEIIEYDDNRGIGKIMTEERRVFEFTKNDFTIPDVRPERCMYVELVITEGKVAITRAVKKSKFYNPYNFVRPMSEQENQFFERKPPQKHSIYEGISGIIDCNLRVKTPLFIGGGRQGPQGEHQFLDFFTIDEKPVVPGSSLRGMVRSVYETITDSCYSVIDKKLLWRRMSRTDATGLKAAIVIRENGRLKLQVYQVPEFPNCYKQFDDMQLAEWMPL